MGQAVFSPIGYCSARDLQTLTDLVGGDESLRLARRRLCRQKLPPSLGLAFVFGFRLVRRCCYFLRVISHQ